MEWNETKRNETKRKPLAEAEAAVDAKSGLQIYCGGIS